MKNIIYPKSFPTPTEELFLQLLTVPDTQFPEKWTAWQQQMNFDDIPFAEHQLLPLVHLRLQKLGIVGPLNGRIKGVYKRTWFKNQRILESIKNAVTLLDTEKIPSLVLKGIPLLRMVYQDAGARFLGDGDLWVDPTDAPRAIKILLTNGWKYKYPKKIIPPTVSEVHLINDQEVEVDLHWKLFPFDLATNTDHPMTFKKVLADARPLTINGTTCYTASAEDMLIHVIVHGAQINPYRPIRWIIDTVFLINTTPLDWNKVLTKMKDYHFSVALIIAFSYLAQHSTLKVPQSFLDSLAKLEPSQAEVTAYYQRMHREHPLFGRFPQLWKHYWNYKAPDISFKSAYGFIDYLRINWGLEKNIDIFKFIVKKYKQKITPKT
jgi:hypothetical protein